MIEPPLGAPIEGTAEARSAERGGDDAVGGSGAILRYMPGGGHRGPRGGADGSEGGALCGKGVNTAKDLGAELGG